MLGTFAVCALLLVGPIHGGVPEEDLDETARMALMIGKCMISVGTACVGIWQWAIWV